MAGAGRVTDRPQRPAAALDGELLSRLDRRRPGLFVGSLASGALVLVFLYCWGYQIANGIGVTGINRPVFWGFYIINFVFWIGISHAGTLISAILRVTKAEWRRPVTRSAEAITLFALRDRRPLPADSPRPGDDLLLHDPLPQQPDAVAQLPLAPGLGRRRDHDLHRRQRASTCSCR